MYFLSTPVPASAPQRLIDVGDQVTGIFQSTGHAHQIRTDTGGRKLRVAHLSVCGRGRVQAAGASVGHMSLDGRQLQPAHKSFRRFPPAFDAERHHSTGAVRQILFRQSMVFVTQEAWIGDPGNIFIAK